jgi:uncharacterized protein (DUF3820 family)
MTAKVDASRVTARVEGRKMAVELSTLIPGEQFHDLNFMAACIEELKDMAGLAEPPLVEAIERLLPIARLGSTEIPFGVHKGKTFDDAPLTYLDWLCREQENFYKGLRAYLKHPELKSRRRGID